LCVLRSQQVNGYAASTFSSVCVWCLLTCSFVTNPTRALFADTASCPWQQRHRYLGLLGSIPLGSRERSEGRHRNCSFWHEGNPCGRLVGPQCHCAFTVGSQGAMYSTTLTSTNNPTHSRLLYDKPSSFFPRVNSCVGSETTMTSVLTLQPLSLGRCRSVQHLSHSAALHLSAESCCSCSRGDRLRIMRRA
jgi:hypothetical protein